MSTAKLHPLIEKISASMTELTPKGRILGEYIMSRPRKAVFMTTKELAESCEVSEATVVRFVAGIGYDRYSDFQQALRDFVDTELTLLDRLDIADMQAPVAVRFRRTVAEEIDNLQQLYNSLGVEAMEALVVITDSTTCPVLQFADHHLVAASKNIPYLGSPTPMSCLINYLVHELASRQGEALKDHQANLEQSYWENDVLFNMKDLGGRTQQ